MPSACSVQLPASPILYQATSFLETLLGPNDVEYNVLLLTTAKKYVKENAQLWKKIPS